MSPGRRTPVGVVGVGYLGALHASKYAGLDTADLVGVYDTDTDRAREVAEASGCRAFESCDELLESVEAVSIAVPTAAHLESGLAAARAGVHALMEKPLAASSAEARSLADAAAEAGIVLQVGHLERFNPVFEEVHERVTNPRFIECHRLSPFAGRGTDASVVHDVMIHDLDLIDFLVGDELEAVEAIGVPVLSERPDIANARLRFAGGCVANVTASRVSLKRERKLRIFEPSAYVSFDFDGGQAVIATRDPDKAAVAPDNPMAAIEVSQREFAGGDPLNREIAEFVRCVREGGRPLVGAAEGLRALDMADRVLASMPEPEFHG